MIKKNDIVKFFIGDEAIIGRVKYMAPGGFQKWKVFSNTYGYNKVFEIHQDNLKLLEKGQLFKDLWWPNNFFIVLDFYVKNGQIWLKIFGFTKFNIKNIVAGKLVRLVERE